MQGSRRDGLSGNGKYNALRTSDACKISTSDDVNSVTEDSVDFELEKWQAVEHEERKVCRRDFVIKMLFIFLCGVAFGTQVNMMKEDAVSKKVAIENALTTKENEELTKNIEELKQAIVDTENLLQATKRDDVSHLREKEKELEEMRAKLGQTLPNIHDEGTPAAKTDLPAAKTDLPASKPDAISPSKFNTLSFPLLPADKWDKTSGPVPKCDFVTESFQGRGLFSLVGGAVCWVSAAMQQPKDLTAFKIFLGDNSYMNATEKKNDFNSWNKVFQPAHFPKNQPPCRVTPKTLVRKTNGWDCHKPWHRSGLNASTLTRETLSPFVQKLLQPNAQIAAEANNFMKENFGNHVLGVHIRGTDRRVDNKNLALHIKIVPTKRIILAIEKYMQVNPQTDRIFVASDNVPQLNELKSYFGSKVISIQAHRSKNNKAKVHNGKDGDAKLKEVVLDMLLLSKTEYLLKCVSEVSLASVLLNSKLEFDVLNGPDGFVFDEWRSKLLNFQGNRYVARKP